MPHICTRCSNVFDSGEDILKGCPNCGWKKFMFVKNKPGDSKAQMQQPEQIITQAMGVRIPPRRAEKGSMAIEPVARFSQKPAPIATPSPTLCIADRNKQEDIHQSDGKREVNTLESIKITSPGTYELNLTSLFERDELIMAVKEGTYFIDLASVFKKSKKD